MTVRHWVVIDVVLGLINAGFAVNSLCSGNTVGALFSGVVATLCLGMAAQLVHQVRKGMG